MLSFSAALIALAALPVLASASPVSLRGPDGPEEVSLGAGNLTAAMSFASATWNCDGASPPCPGCKKVPSGSSQTPYGCAEWVAHVLNAGAFLPVKLPLCGTLSQYIVDGFDLNRVGTQTTNLMGYLTKLGWKPVASKDIVAGVVCAVDAGDGPWSHAVIGTGAGLCSYHNNARWDVRCASAVISFQLCLKAP